MATPSFPDPGEMFEDPDPDDDELEFRTDDDTLFTETDEKMLDDAFVKKDIGVAPAGKQKPPKGPPQLRPRDRGIDGAMVRERMDELARRRNAVIRKLPIARFRRAARVTLALIVAILLVAAFTYRTDIVRQYPEMDRLYGLVGFGTNVIGLEIDDLNTLRTTRDGNPAIVVNAEISNITSRVAYVPNVLVSLLGTDGRVIYEWSVTPSVRSILPGDVLSIDTQLTAPPQGVEAVRLTFVEGSGRAD